MVSSIESLPCIQDSQLGLNGVLYRESPLQHLVSAQAERHTFTLLSSLVLLPVLFLLWTSCHSCGLSSSGEFWMPASNCPVALFWEPLLPLERGLTSASCCPAAKSASRGPALSPSKEGPAPSERGDVIISHCSHPSLLRTRCPLVSRKELLPMHSKM